MTKAQNEVAKWDELWHLYADLKMHGEKQTADALDAVNWTMTVEQYPDLTAEEIASAVCGGVGL